MYINSKSVFSVLLSALVVFGVTGCLDSSSSSDDDGESNHASSFDHVSIEKSVRYSSSDGLSFVQATQYGDQSALGKMCGAQVNDRYIESEKALVYGGSDVPESELRRVARGVHKFYHELIDDFGLDEESFSQTYNAVFVNKFFWSGLHEPEYQGDFGYAETYLSDNHGFSGHISREGELARELLKLTGYQLRDFFGYVFRDRHDGVDDFESSFIYREDFGVPSELTSSGLSYDPHFEADKFVVCVDPKMDQELGQGEGHIWGMSIKPEGGDKLMKHELVHYFQNRLVGGDTTYAVPRWFLEGQAVSMAGQHITDANDIGQRNPIHVEKHTDEIDSDARYGDYALAYEFIESSSDLKDLNDALSVSFLTSTYIANKSHATGTPIGDIDQLQFIKERLSGVMKTPSGEALEYSELRDDFLRLIAD